MSRRGNKVLFTKTALDAFTCPPGQKDAWVFDSDLQGFGVRITTAGSKVFYLQYSVAGRVRRHRLGAYGVLTLDQARRLARIAAGEVAGGNDPRADRLAKRRAAVVAEAGGGGRSLHAARDGGRVARGLPLPAKPAPISAR